MKAFLLSLALSTGLCVSARADFTIVQKVEGGKAGGNEIIMKLKGDKVRVEATPQMTMIVDGKTGETVTLMNAQKKFLRISGDKAKAIAERQPGTIEIGEFAPRQSLAGKAHPGRSE